MILQIIRAFLVGGLFCVIAQVLIDKTKLTPARILVSYVVAGVILGAIGIYKPIVDFAGAGATVPLTGFGYLISEGIREAVDKQGWCSDIFRRLYLGVSGEDKCKAFCSHK